MKKKLFYYILIFIIASLGVVALTACKKTPAVTMTETENGIYVSALPKQYYVVGEKLSFEGGEITVNLTKKGAGINDGQTGCKTISMTDPDVSVTHPGTSIAGKVNVAVLTYHDFKASFKYYVTKEEDAILSVTYSVEEDGVAPDTTYAVSDTRTNANFNDLIVTVKYKNASKSDEIIKISTKAFSSFGISLSGFDVTAVGSGTLILSYLASDYVMDYSVIAEDWVESVILLKSHLVTSYLVGDAFVGGNTKLYVTYNSGKTESSLVTADDLTGFSTDSVGTGFTATVKDVTDADNTFTYNVYSPTDTENMSKLVAYSGTGFLDVNDDMTYAEYLHANVFHIIVGSNYVTVYGDSEGISVTQKSDGSNFDEAAYNAVLTKGQEVELLFTYRGNTALTEDITITVIKKWLNTEITGWNYNYSLPLNADFDFGAATLKMIFDDGTFDTYVIQEVFEMTTFADRPFNINNEDAQQVSIINTETVGEFKKVYYIAVQGEVTIDGENYDHSDTGRLYIVYTVKESE